MLTVFYTDSIPQNTVSIPENTVSIPENTVSIPENTVSIPSAYGRGLRPLPIGPPPFDVAQTKALTILNTPKPSTKT
jgi:hypothetical protein